ncbi:uncharacterized protein AKAW2_70728S [Aspergillus luchuensis]|uniref:Transmembrane protein n=1 Tax=Aspergillus kawachii TaxID=1069201 RepID=A0A7R8A2I2_ASPKA|nr:uncharacterized protein AKAW2_70728S [Aspergillus luchuensis]BCS03849.1 hypothetical protein AKAW2_70728S [Aspergillus luchuensis]
MESRIGSGFWTLRLSGVIFFDDAFFVTFLPHYFSDSAPYSFLFLRLPSFFHHPAFFFFWLHICERRFCILSGNYFRRLRDRRKSIARLVVWNVPVPKFVFTFVFISRGL